MTQDLDALPLPEPDGYAGRDYYHRSSGMFTVPVTENARFTEQQIRADRIKVWELAMRKAQEGREPVGYLCGPLEWNPRQSETVVKITRRQQSEYGFTHPIYDSPPPKSDEAMDALLAARDYVQQALVEHDRMYCRHPATESDRKLIVDDLAQVDAALSAQQKGKK